jgi:hypothetical protein
MPEPVLQQEKEPIVKWTYSRKEWSYYQGWTKRKKGIFHYLFHCFQTMGNVQIPGITITKEAVITNTQYQPFADGHRELKQVHIRDEGRMNVLEIQYEVQTGTASKQTGIFILVPKGKLREAVELQDCLNRKGNGKE